MTVWVSLAPELDLDLYTVKMVLGGCVILNPLIWLALAWRLYIRTGQISLTFGKSEEGPIELLGPEDSFIII